VHRPLAVDAYSLILGLFTLTDRQRHIVVQRHLRGRTLEDVATELGVSRQAVSRCELKALDHLRARLAPFRLTA
jgi:RNA polymerase sigma factor (sigma-70 family)